MTEAEWLAYSDPESMLLFLRGRCSDRKLRLFACACTQRIWHLLEDDRTRKVLELAERSADTLVPEDQIQTATQANYDFIRSVGWRTAANKAATVANAAAAGNAWAAAWNVVTDAWAAIRLSNPKQSSDEDRHQRLLLSEIIGNPFRHISLDPAWLKANDGAVPKTAQQIYEERAFAFMPFLVDALLDAGCDNEDMLAHCRSAGPHVRGCWVIDLILGKE